MAIKAYVSIPVTQGDLRKLHRLFGYVKSNPNRSIMIRPCHIFELEHLSTHRIRKKKNRKTKEEEGEEKEEVEEVEEVGSKKEVKFTE